MGVNPSQAKTICKCLMLQCYKVTLLHFASYGLNRRCYGSLPRVLRFVDLEVTSRSLPPPDADSYTQSSPLPGR